MKATVVTSPGGPEVLQVREVEDPKIKDYEVLVKVEATSLNQADSLQRLGFYPPPPGCSELLGLECSGTIEAVGRQVSRWKAGDQVCAVLTGGGYAEKVAVPAGQILPLPPGISLKDAASLPEVACTVWSTVFTTSVDVILDILGAAYFQRNLDALNFDGRLFVIGTMGGLVTELDLRVVLAKRLTIQGTRICFPFSLQEVYDLLTFCLTCNISILSCLCMQRLACDLEVEKNKAFIVSETEKNVWSAIAAGKVKK
ncbi:putative NADPH:quinone reductase [Rosa chinensis]|uniref:Putative NADPH:quinone reductase n=1 Tax=Rosa chinensis TaxID=74649 RepID=A0A2P6Q3N7_ROSCH|nr:putative NADPH:quinone reductase [Rosa chinensis]